MAVPRDLHRSLRVLGVGGDLVTDLYLRLRAERQTLAAEIVRLADDKCNQLPYWERLSPIDRQKLGDLDDYQPIDDMLVALAAEVIELKRELAGAPRIPSALALGSAIARAQAALPARASFFDSASYGAVMHMKICELLGIDSKLLDLGWSPEIPGHFVAKAFGHEVTFA